MEGIQDVFAAIPLDAALYGTALVLAILLRLGRASYEWLNGPHTYAAGIIMGLGGAALKLAANRPIADVVEQGLALAAVVLLFERLLRAGGGKLGLPKDNEWVKSQEKTDEANSSAAHAADPDVGSGSGGGAG